MDVWTVGVDLGGTKVAMGLVDPRQQIVARERIATHPERGAQDLVARMAACIARLSRQVPQGERLGAVGVCSPGPVDSQQGLLIDPPNLHGLQHTPLRAMLSEALGLPVNLEHDAKAAAWGEHLYGAGRKDSSMVYIVVGTGVGGAVIIDGAIYRGLANTAGEIGHVTLDPDGRLCGCGNRGCVETFLSGPFIARRYHLALHGVWPDGEPPVDAAVVSQRAAVGETLARDVLADAGRALGRAVATMGMVLDVELHVIGGSVAKAGDLLFASAREVLAHHCYGSVAERLRIVGNALGEDGPILGCAAQARALLGG